jgi:hypothetical protein
MAADRPHFFDPATEQGVLRLSIAASLLLAAAAVVFGLLANSSLIIFDGIYGLIDVVMTWLSLLVARLIALSTRPMRCNRGSTSASPWASGTWSRSCWGERHADDRRGAVCAGQCGGCADVRRPPHRAGPGHRLRRAVDRGEGALAWFVLRANRRIGGVHRAGREELGDRGQHVGLLPAGLPRRRAGAGTRWPGSGRTSTRPSSPSSACW